MPSECRSEVHGSDLEGLGDQLQSAGRQLLHGHVGVRKRVHYVEAVTLKCTRISGITLVVEVGSIGGDGVQEVLARHAQTVSGQRSGLRSALLSGLRHVEVLPELLRGLAGNQMVEPHGQQQWVACHEVQY